MQTLELFRHPSTLFWLFVPATILAWTWTRRGRAVALPFDHTGPRGGGTQGGAWTRSFIRLADSIPALILALVVLILAGPQTWGSPRSKRVLTNIQFCIDVSGSMTAKFGDGDRYDASMAAINGFLDFRDGDAFGLTFFGNSVLHWVPLTTDVSAFRCAPPFMRPGHIPSWFGGTEIGKALRECRKILVEREEGDRMIILISDGMSSDLYGGRDEELARDLVRDDIIVYAVHIAPGPPPDQIVRITAMTGGEVFKPEDTEGLKRIFAAIDRMQKARFEKSLPEACDDFQPWCLFGLGTLGLALLALFGLRYTPW